MRTVSIYTYIYIIRPRGRKRNVNSTEGTVYSPANIKIFTRNLSTRGPLARPEARRSRDFHKINFAPSEIATLEARSRAVALEK